MQWVRQEAPLGRIEILDVVEVFFTADPPPADGLFLSAEAGSAWTLAYPDFRVVVPRGLEGGIPLGYPLPQGERMFLHFINRWIDINRRGGVVEELYEHWVLGRRAESKEPRWSILRDVLGWID